MGALRPARARSTAAAAARSTHLLTDGTGLPLAWTLTGANRNDGTQLLLLVEAIPPERGRPGPLKRRPKRVVADRGYDHEIYRRQLRALGVTPLIARRLTEHGSGLGSWRWVVERTFERTFAWLHQFYRLHVRYERSEQTHQALLDLACCLICFKRLQHSLCYELLAGDRDEVPGAMKLALERPAQHAFEPVRSFKEALERHARFDSLPVEEVDEIFGRDVPGCPWCERTSADSADGRVKQ